MYVDGVKVGMMEGGCYFNVGVYFLFVQDGYFWLCVGGNVWGGDVVVNIK